MSQANVEVAKRAFEAFQQRLMSVHAPEFAALDLTMAQAKLLYVVTAAGGMEALARARELGPTALTLDIMMPDLDGWTVLAALKGDPALADIPVIVVTILDEKNRGFAGTD